MKKFIIFSVSFIALFSILQVLSGIFLTAVYTPDMDEAWEMSANLPQGVILRSGGSPFLSALLLAFISASVAYFISERISKRTKNFR